MFLNLTKELVKDQQEDAELPQQLPGASDQTGSDEMSMSTDTFTERDGTKLPPGFIPDLSQMQTVTDGLIWAPRLPSLLKTTAQMGKPNQESQNQ